MKIKSSNDNFSVISVKNAEGDPDTVAQILVQNKIDYEPKVSVIIPVYNVENYLRECLDSVVNQTLKEIEIICVDDGSTDKSLDTLLEYAKKDNRITVLKQENLHAGVARNAGLAVARGEYLSFLDSDDFFELNMLEEMYKKAKEDTSDIVVCNANVYAEGNLTPLKWIVNERYIKDSTFSCSSKENASHIFQAFVAFPWNKIFSRELIDNHKLYFSSSQHHNDTSFVMGSIVIANRISYITENYINYRRRNDSLCHTKSGNEEAMKLSIISTFNNIKNTPNYNLVKQSFINYIVEFMGHYYDKHSKKSREKISKDIKTLYNYFNIADFDKSYFFDIKKLDKIKDIINRTTIPIILSSDNNYAPFMYITMLSILKNAHSHTFYDFYLMVPSAFSKINENTIMQLKEKYNCDIHFLDMKNAFSDLTMQISHITSPTYYRLLAGDLLPQEYDKCIYLDVDICVCQDLSPLYNIDMGNNYLAGVKAAIYCIRSDYHKSRLSIPDVSNYINAGVLLMNLKKIREDNLTTKFLELSKKNYSSQDQDVVNVACFGKILVLPIKYNLMTKYRALFKIEDEQREDIERIYEKENIDTALNNPIIIHYADKIKPWNNKKTPLADTWWHYAKLSPYFKDKFIKSFMFFLLFPYYLLATYFLRHKKNKLLAQQA